MSYTQQPGMSEGNYSAGRAPSSIYNQPAQGRQPRDTPADHAMVNLVNSFANAGLNVSGTTNIPGSAGIAANQFPMGTGQYFYTHDGQLVYAPAPYQAPVAPTQLPESTFSQYAPAMQFMPQASFPSYVQGYPIVPFTPGRGAFYSDRQDSVVISKDLPSLENRRGSYSTNESTPGTPYYGSMGSREHGIGVTVVDRSPIYSTPSPQNLPHTHVVPVQVGKPLPYKANGINSIEIDSLLAQHPAIPRAVPAVFTPRENMRTLDQSLSNPRPDNRNVYIRGLHPNTDDDTLAAYAIRFGKVETSKAIIDTSTGACKGFGFAKYVDVRDAENCIRGFYKLGYEVGFARESFNARLKAEGDDGSTNLYVSNLPKTMTESELGAVFMDYEVSSSRILRDNQGQSRGVGFARFETRDICEEVIRKYHGQPIGDEGLLLQVRYADTPAQKDLKRVTTERRQFRTTEYNVGAYRTVADIVALSPTLSLSPLMPARMAQIARHIPISRNFTSPWKRDTSASATTSAGFVDSGVHFRDVDRSLKSTHTQSSTAKGLTPTASTPTVSEDGSNDEVTIHCSPAAVVGGSQVAN